VLFFSIARLDRLVWVLMCGALAPICNVIMSSHCCSVTHYSSCGHAFHPGNLHGRHWLWPQVMGGLVGLFSGVAVLQSRSSERTGTPCVLSALNCRKARWKPVGSSHPVLNKISCREEQLLFSWVARFSTGVSRSGCNTSGLSGLRCKLSHSLQPMRFLLRLGVAIAYYCVSFLIHLCTVDVLIQSLS